MRTFLLLTLLASVAVGAERPLYSSKPLTDAELQGRSLRELTLMRNWIYAKRGNEFRRAWLNDYFSKLDWYEPNQTAFLLGSGAAALDPAELKIDDANAERIATYESSLTVEQLKAMRDAIRERVAKTKKLEPNDNIELRLLSIRLGSWAGEGAPPPDLTPLENPARLDKLLKLTDLDDLSPRDLKLLRNTIFARKGRTFETDLVKGHFKTVEWYRADPKYSDAKLSAVDKKNVKLIQSLERQLKRESEPNFMIAA